MRAVIFANGTFNDIPGALSEIIPEDLLIAADGGTVHCLQLGLIPDVVIGDLDSLPTSQWEALRTQDTHFIIHSPDKDKTDLELALGYAVLQGAQDIILFGLTGGRLDQSLANLLLLSKDEWSNARLVVCNGPDKAFLLHSGDNLTIEGQPGDIVSLIALTPIVARVTTQGLRWPLEAADLQFGSTLSVSNQISQTPTQVQIGEGCLLVVHRGENAAIS